MDGETVVAGSNRSVTSHQRARLSLLVANTSALKLRRSYIAPIRWNENTGPNWSNPVMHVSGQAKADEALHGRLAQTGLPITIVIRDSTPSGQSRCPNMHFPTPKVPLLQRALVCSGPGTLALKAVPVPRLGVEEVLVRTVAVALNPSDHKLLDQSTTAGAISGADLAGIVVRVGSGTETQAHLQVGDRVCGFAFGANPGNPQHGAFAQYVAAPARLCVRLPDGVDFLLWQLVHGVERRHRQQGERRPAQRGRPARVAGQQRRAHDLGQHPCLDHVPVRHGDLPPCIACGMVETLLGEGQGGGPVAERVMADVCNN